MRKLLFFLLVLTFAPVDSRAQQPSAKEVLGKIAAVYQTCQSYYDEGSIGGEGNVFHNGHFRTTFVRPEHFAFELWFGSERKDKKDYWVAWKNGDSVSIWGPESAIANFKNDEVPLDIGLSRLGPFSNGASLTISPLLQPAPFRISDILASMTDVKIAGEEKIDGNQAFIIDGTLPGQQVRLWVDKSSFLILKTSRKLEFAGKKLEATVRFKPRVNIRIPPEQLLFKRPLDQKASASSTSPNELRERAPRLRAFGSSLTFVQDGKWKMSNERPAADDDVGRVDTDLVVSPVLVVDSTGKPVTGLTRADFVVKEDDTVQEIASFSLGDSKEVPRSIVLVIDYSGSQLPYIRTSIEAAKMLVDKLNPKDRMAVVTDDVKLVVDFTSDKEFLKSQLDSFKVSALSGQLGASEQYDALMATLGELFSREDIRPIVIFQTDGDQLEGLKGSPALSHFLLPRKYGLEDIQTAAERERASIYSVISGLRFIGVPENELAQRGKADWENRDKAYTELLRLKDPYTKVETTPPTKVFFETSARLWLRRQTALVNLSKLTGAWAEFLEQPGQAEEIYDRILKDIDRRYVIGYYPTNRARDGKRRRVRIEIRNHPEYEVWGHKTYFSRDER